MKILTVTNRKGGVGKTSLSRTLAEYFSIVKKLRVLAIDLDSQCSLSHLFLDMDLSLVGELGVRPPVHPKYNPDDPEDKDWNGRSSSANLWVGGGAVPYPVQRPALAKTLEILPGDKDALTSVEEQDRPGVIAEIEEELKNVLAADAVREAYDLVIIDTGPGESPLARSALRACTHLLIPIEVEPQSVRGLYEMIGEIRKEDMRRTIETKINVVAIQPNKFKVRRTLHNSLLKTLRENFKDLVSPVVLPDLAGFAERDADLARPTSLFEMPPSSKPRQIAEEFCRYVDGRMYEVAACA